MSCFLLRGNVFALDFADSAAAAVYVENSRAVSSELSARGPDHGSRGSGLRNVGPREEEAAR